MLRKIVGTTGTRVLNALFALINLYLLTNFIGKEGMGVLGIIILDISVIQIIFDFVAGSAIIYFASRANQWQLFIPAIIWIIIVSVLTFLIYQIVILISPAFALLLVPEGHINDIILLTAINGLMVINYNLLLGKGKIMAYNVLFTIQICTSLIVFITQLLIFNNQSIDAFLWGLYSGYGISFIIGLFIAFYKSGKIKLAGWFKVTKKVLQYGAITITGNLLTIGNNRISYYIIRYFLGLPVLGIYTAGVQLTEGLKVIGQSLAVVQFSTIANSRDNEYSRILTIRLMKIAVIITTLSLLILILIPKDIYSLILTNDFSSVKSLIIALSPGVIALAANNIFSHYFSGLGDPKVNVYAKISGLIVTLVLIFILIPLYGITGAAITASASYITTVIYQYMVFCKRTKTELKEWIPSIEDYKALRLLLKKSGKHASPEKLSQ